MEDESDREMGLVPEGLFKAWKECAQNIEKKVAQMEDDLMCPSLFGDPMKAAASESFVNQLIEEIAAIRESIRTLTEEIKSSIDNQMHVLEELSSVRDSALTQIMETENHLEKFGYKRLEGSTTDLHSFETSTFCNDSKKTFNDSEVSCPGTATLDSQDSNLSSQACITPFITEKKTAHSTSKIGPRRVIESEFSELEDNSSDPSGKSMDDSCESHTYSAAFYELQKKFKMSKV